MIRCRQGLGLCAALVLCGICLGSSGCPGVTRPLERLDVTVQEVAATIIRPDSAPDNTPADNDGPVGDNTDDNTDDNSPARDNIGDNIGDSVVVRIRLSVFNPNPTPMTARALDWQLAIGDGQPLSGRLPLDSALPGRRTTVIEAQTRIAPQAAGAISSPVEVGHSRYHLRGTVHLFSGRGDQGAVFNQQGQLAPW